MNRWQRLAEHVWESGHLLPPALYLHRDNHWVCAIQLNSPIDAEDMAIALSAWAGTDSDAAAYVADSVIRPLDGPGAVCPCDQDGCQACGDTGVFRGYEEALLVVAFTDQGSLVVTMPYGEEGWGRSRVREPDEGTTLRDLIDRTLATRARMKGTMTLEDSLTFMAGYGLRVDRGMIPDE